MNKTIPKISIDKSKIQSNIKVPKLKTIKVKILSGKYKGKIDTIENVVLRKKLAFLKTYNKRIRFTMVNGKKTMQWYASPIHLSNLKLLNE